MLFWTCPECGRECSPALRQCPACPPPSEPQPLDATLGRTEADGGILALAHNLETIHALPLLAPVAEQSIQAAEHGRPSHASSTATLIEETATGPETPVRFVVEDMAAPAEQALLVLAEETLAIPVKQTVDSLVRPLVESVDATEDKQLSPETEADLVDDVSLAEPETPSEPEAIAEPEAALTVADHKSSDLELLAEEVSETVVPEPEPIAAALLQSLSEVASGPELAYPVESPEPAEGQSPEPESSIAPLALSPPALECLSVTESVSEVASVPELAYPVEAPEPAEEEGLEPQASIAPLAQSFPALEALSVADSASEVAAVPELAYPVEAPQPAEDEGLEPESSIAPLAQSLPALEALAVAESVSEVASVPELNVTAASESHPVEAPEPAEDQSPEPEASTAPVAQSPAAFETLAVAEFVCELTAVPEPDSVDSRQLALNLEPPPQLDPLAQAANAVEREAASEPPAAPLNQETALAGSPTAVESLPPLAAQGPPEQLAALPLGTSEPEPAVDPQDARDLEATEALLGALEHHAEALVDAIHAELEAERAAIGQLAASFQRCCSTALLAAPAEIVTAPAPPVFEWIRTPRPILRPLAPPAGNLVGQSAQPHAPTLAGPCLSPELRSLTELENPKRLRRARPFPGWMASLLGATLLVLLAVTSLQYFGSQNDAKASTATGSQNAATVNGAGEALNKSVEISGLRLATTWTGKQQVRFLIVNHSDRDLSGVTVQVAVRSSDLAPGAAPILLIHAPLGSLGPYQSKEIRTDLDSGLPASALSDWQSLRTEVQVTRSE